MNRLTSVDGRALKASAATLLNVEHGIYVVLGAALAVTALMALAGAIIALFVALWNGAAASLETSDTLFDIIARLLFVLMLAEILYTVRVSLRSGALAGEPFLIVGLIACIRRVLVITLEYSHSTASGAKTEEIFQHSMIELGVLGGLILVMVASIYFLRRSHADPEPDITSAEGFQR